MINGFRKGTHYNLPANIVVLENKDTTVKLTLSPSKLRCGFAAGTGLVSEAASTSEDTADLHLNRMERFCMALSRLLGTRNFHRVEPQLGAIRLRYSLG